MPNDDAHTPPTNGRYGLNQHLLHPAALTHPTALNHPATLSGASALTQSTDLQLTKEHSDMEDRNILDQIGDKVSQEAMSARDSLQKLFDPTMQHYQTYVGYPRQPEVDVSQQMEQHKEVDIDMDR